MDYATFQLVMTFLANYTIGAVVTIFDSVVLLTSPRMTILDLLCVLGVIDEIYEFLNQLRR